ncbi:putative pentatricopeptide repeat-containing protein At5g13230, mitochondrial [Coffea arabica]|uniref:Pentatricopeptide repeat-containing protein At5g13230, mitochondrial n=1 Tax=Coffea arabica TaxID=13443 RepID=A0A6P6S8S6_COFAR|nr:putative pentatricopeptide repeat-containing protein At5g13230, mitochondrial [Coffea arabica]XP_027062544.1 putative pentatricopeptide repeat-containing protein At5g13230, mitochondrial [Coffea arabica]XP_027062545.1 putative pentatricopeptide repeat-containing protein At5g13230, mitochondrial [Coffea arabica]
MIRLLSRRELQWTNSCRLFKLLAFVRSQQYGFSFVSAQLAQEEEESLISCKMPPFTPRVSNSHAYANILQNCVENSEPIRGKATHCDIIKRGGCLDLFARNVLLNLYVKCELWYDARQLFDEMPDRNVVSFVTLIQGCSMSERYNEAVQLFGRLHKEGHKLNPYVFTTILKMLVTMEWTELTWSIHACIYKLGYHNDAYVGTALIDAYSVSGFVDTGKEVFDVIEGKDMVCWTGMVSCYVENDCFPEALSLFDQMRMAGFKPNNFTFVSVIKASLGLDAMGMGKSVHGYVLKAGYQMDSYVGISLLDLYTATGDIDDSRQMFEEIPKDDVIPWSFMIARYSQSDRCDEALELFCRMRESLVVPNQFTFASVLQSCATKQAFDFGRQTHCHVIKVGLVSDVFVSNALMDVYAKCGKMDGAMNLFADAAIINDVSWNTIIVGHVQLGDAEKALDLFLTMVDNRVQASDVTCSSILRACASLAALETGAQMHTFIIKTLHDKDVAVGNALIDMYAKCGNIKDARLVFDTMNKQDTVSWNALISAYSMHGLGSEALKIFERMQKTDVKPNQLTFVGVLSACSNTGSLDKGQAYFSSMLKTYNVEPCVEHYTCMVSLLGKMGHLDKAVKLIEEIPFEPSVMIWRALLGACVIHKNVEIGKISAQHVLEMDPHDEAAYILLSNIYASVKRWENVSSVRKIMKKKRVKKEPGASWIEHQGIVHYFTVGDVSHPDRKLIQGMLEWLNLRCNRAGYIPISDVILLDVEDDEKARLLWMHSERLALAFSLVRTPSGTPIRIIKNLRICLDCHAVIKLISKQTQRDIVIRDVNRFHHFEDGICSCGDYW